MVGLIFFSNSLGGDWEADKVTNMNALCLGLKLSSDRLRHWSWVGFIWFLHGSSHLNSVCLFSFSKWSGFFRGSVSKSPDFGSQIKYQTSE